MAEILSAIIRAGGSTAMTDPVTGDELKTWMAQDPDRSAWHVAESPEGEVLGFQWIEPHGKLPPEACDIATFVRIGETGLGIGSRLFKATEKSARLLGYEWINATIRADNEGGLIYYQSRGFRVWDRQSGIALGNGQVVDRILTRYDLD